MRFGVPSGTSFQHLQGPGPITLTELPHQCQGQNDGDRDENDQVVPIHVPVPEEWEWKTQIRAHTTSGVWGGLACLHLQSESPVVPLNDLQRILVYSSESSCPHLQNGHVFSTLLLSEED